MLAHSFKLELPREKDDAKRSYLQALKSFWTAYYDLRRLTLYDFANRKLLYVPEE